jgi:hypothetical protein
MVDVAKLRETARDLRECAIQIVRDSKASPYPTSKEDSGLLYKAAKELDDACDEIIRLRG